MLPQEDIDAILMSAQQAVAELTAEADTASPAAAPKPAVAPKPAAAPKPTAAPAPAPAAVRKPGGAASATATPAVHRGPSEEERIRDILRIRVPVVVRLAERPMFVNEIMKIVPGKILEFTRTVNEELDLMVNNHPVGAGVAVKVNEHFGLRVSFVGDVRQRIRSLTAG